MVERYDYLVVGAGYFGAQIALILSRLGARVALVDRAEEICTRASYANQARIHNGYHYLRSYSTAMGSHRNYDRFLREMHGSVSGDFEHIYAIAGQGSYTNAYQFQRFCRELGLPFSRVSAESRALFDRNRIEDMFVVREAAFNALAVRRELLTQLKRAPGIELMLQTECRRIDIVAPDLLKISTSRQPIEARGVFVVTYADMNALLRRSNLPLLPLKAEIAEVCLVDVPQELRQKAVTVMDGPFFSTMPMPAEGTHSLTHVRYTPHVAWDLSEQDLSSTAILSAYKQESRFAYMQRDAARYLPAAAAMKYRGSLFEVKAIPIRHEIDDGRPIIVSRLHDEPTCIAVLGSKIDSGYELEGAVLSCLSGRQPAMVAD